MMKCLNCPLWEQKSRSSAVQTAMIYDIPLEVKSTFTERKGIKFLVKKILIIQKV